MSLNGAEEMIGLDTGFFIELMNGTPKAVGLWKSALDDEIEFVASSLTLFEIDRLGLKGKLTGSEAILEAINAVTSVAWLDREILSLAARLSHGLGIRSMDSLILASLVSNGCTEIYTTDSDFEAYQSATVTVRNLRKSR
jgi:predicted nucleic acid-binding protein